MTRQRLLLAVVSVLLGLESGVAYAQGEALPPGEARATVERMCSVCHKLDRISRSSGYGVEEWRALTATMLDLSASGGSEKAVSEYLAAHFPAHSKLTPTLVPGEMRIEFEEWVTPTLGQRARDPVQAPDGAIWWAGQWANLIGRLDPVTGEMEEYPLPPGAMPHTVTIDAEGDVWYTGNKNATIGKFDVETGKTTAFKMPDPAARDPHTAVFDADGILWFTLQHSNMVGRLDPGSGAIRLVTLKTPDSRPYGIKIDAQGVPWVACNGSNCLVRVDPASMALEEVELPGAGTTVRRLDIADDGVIWYVNSSGGRLGRFDPSTGAIKEWPSPSGPRSHPYAIAILGGAIWYNESGKRPDTLVRFDPRTKQFQSWPIPSGKVYAGIIRHMLPTREGNLLIHQSSTNRIILVKPAG